MYCIHSSLVSDIWHNIVYALTTRHFLKETNRLPSASLFSFCSHSMGERTRIPYKSGTLLLNLKKIWKWIPLKPKTNFHLRVRAGSNRKFYFHFAWILNFKCKLQIHSLQIACIFKFNEFTLPIIIINTPNNYYNYNIMFTPMQQMNRMMRISQNENRNLATIYFEITIFRLPCAQAN